VRTRPAALTDDQLAVALSHGWSWGATRLDYAPVGYGSYHWVVTDEGGTRWFVTADDLAARGPDRAAETFERLQRALTTAYAVKHDGRLDFVVAPVAAVDGSVVRRVDERYAVAVYPHLDDAVHPDGSDRSWLVEMLVDLHGSTELVRGVAGVEDFAEPDRADLERALQELERPWTGGPFAERTRGVLADHLPVLRSLLDVHDAWVTTARDGEAPWVLTHGEPKLNNVMVTAAGHRLIDWDTALVAPAARDLWMADAGSGEVLAGYVEQTGRRVRETDLELYRLRWELADIASVTRVLRGPHERDADTELAWGCIEDIAGLPLRWPDLV
jgi:spectinomycin phosphotransferase